MRHLAFLKSLLRHKWFTLLECRRLGILRLGIIHDWTKFTPSEWGPYVQWFYGERVAIECSLPHERGNKRGDSLIAFEPGEDGLVIPHHFVVMSYDSELEIAECLPWSAKEAFDVAWNHHQKSNKHHWQFWVLIGGQDSTRCLPMPDRYRREMLADWRGAGRAYGNPDTKGWYLKNKDKIQLHDDTREWIEEQLGVKS